ncbi:MAG TPA: FtsX-like permease family protein, partial [Syntrophomonadaceae bacterium]|nr:FtsX-like permease family protein [Syntrophomonadaceae bacterium]
ITVNKPIKEGELNTIANIEGVIKVEAFLHLPVRLTYQGQNEEDLIIAYNPDMSLKKISDEEGQTLFIPPEGLIVSQQLAKKLGVSTGDEIGIETLLPNSPPKYSLIKITGISHQMFGSSNYMDLDAANRLIEEKALVSGAMVKAEVGKTSLVEDELNKMLNISSISSLQKELDNFTSNMGAATVSVSIMVLFAVILGFAIVYNASLIAFIERERELASLRVIGFSNRELAGLLGKENLLQAIIGIVLGLPLGKLLAKSFIASVETDLYSFPVIIYPLTYIIASLTAIVFIVLAHRLAIRGVKKIVLVEALKNQD